MNSQNFVDLELTFPTIPLGQSGQRGQPDILEDSFLDLSLQFTPCDPVSRDEALNDDTINSQSNFLDLEFTFPAIPLGQSCQRGQPDIPEDSFLDLSLQFTPRDPVSLDEAFNDDAGSSRRARETYSFDSESEISARNQQSDPLEHNLQPSTAITESHVVPIAPLPPPSPPLPTYTCPICLGPMTEETTTRCGHIFCKDCIIRSLSTGDRCPICRHKITPRGLHRLYFYDAL
ncbi:putative transcription factor C2H2 family [Helianthus debilis subsp. tardiflorus]